MRVARLLLPTLVLVTLRTAIAAPASVAPVSPGSPTTATQVTATTVTAAPVPVAPPVRQDSAGAPATSMQSAPTTRAASRVAAASSISVEDPTKTYYALGARYRGIILPAFVTGLFARQATTQYFNNFGLEFDIRRDGFSLTPSLSFLGMGTDPILFADKSKDEAYAQNWSQITSQLKGLMLGLDMQWSTPLDRNVFLEYGIGVGLGIMFGDVGVNWVYRDANGAFVPCATTTSDISAGVTSGANTGCAPTMHDTNNNPPRVGSYTEPSWFDGGQKPNVIPWLSMPQLGLRVNPTPEFQARIGGGMSLIGPWFGVSMSYGFPQPPAKYAAPSAAPSRR